MHNQISAIHYSTKSPPKTQAGQVKIQSFKKFIRHVHTGYAVKLKVAVVLLTPPFVAESFQVNMKETFGDMTERLAAFPYLCVIPPLLLKDTGQEGPLLVQLSEGTALSTVNDAVGWSRRV